MEETPRITQPFAAVHKPFNSRPYKVCIVGAGVAGLSAAEALVLGSQDNRIGDGINVEVKLLEAVNVPGGRAVTLPFAGGLIDGGAQYIHGTCEGNAVYQRAKQHGLKLSGNFPTYLETTVRINQDGKQVLNGIVDEVTDLYSDVIVRSQVASYRKEREEGSDKTVGDFVKRYFERYFRAASGSPKDKHLKANLLRMFTIMECCYSACHSLHDLMLQDFGEYKELIGNVTFERGYRDLVDTFLANLPPGTVEYNKPVLKIDWNCHEHEREVQPNLPPVTIATKDGDRYEADYVVVTPSLGYLKENAGSMFSPRLPQDKLDVILRMGYGTTGKVWLEYEAPFWSEHWDGFYLVWDESPSDIIKLKNKFKKKEWYKHIYGFRRLHGNPRVLFAFLTGKAAEYVETLDNDEIAGTLTKVLRQFLKNPNIPLPINVHKTTWYSNPYVRGAYSYVAAGSEGADIDRLAEPVCFPAHNGTKQPVICFAGEATHRTFYSTSHGAMLSGQREAERILADIRCRARMAATETQNEASQY